MAAPHMTSHRAHISRLEFGALATFMAQLGPELGFRVLAVSWPRLGARGVAVTVAGAAADCHGACDKKRLRGIKWIN